MHCAGSLPPCEWQDPSFDLGGSFQWMALAMFLPFMLFSFLLGGGSIVHVPLVQIAATIFLALYAAATKAGMSGTSRHMRTLGQKTTLTPHLLSHLHTSHTQTSHAHLALTPSHTLVIVSRHVMSCRVSRHVISGHVMLRCYAVSCCVKTSPVMYHVICNVMSCHVLSCQVALCHVMSCRHVLSFRVVALRRITSRQAATTH